MSGSFGSFQMGRSALNAFRLGMQTVGHNISNMNTEGYTRQRVNFRTVTPEDIPHVGQLGQGMYADDIVRLRDEFLDFQYRDNMADLGYWDKINDLYDSIQSYISEPNSSGIRSAMDTFFTNLQTLQQTPEDVAARRALVESANSLGMMMSNLVNSFNTYNDAVNLSIKQSVDEANGMLRNIAELNKRIAQAEALDQNANDLYDQRDVLVDKLSKMMDISYNEPKEYNGVKGEFFLSVNGRVLVQGEHVRELKAHAFMWDNQVYYDVQVSENEFDIVEDPNITEALATGPEGTYMLVVDRIANGQEWTIGGGNAHCLETFAVMTSGFQDGIILNSSSESIPYKLQFRTLNENQEPSVLTVKIDKQSSGGWKLRAEFNGTQTDETTITADSLKSSDLVNFINSSASSQGMNLSATEDETTHAITFNTSSSYASPLELTDYSGMLGPLSEAKRELLSVDMRAEPNNLTEALNISGSFRIQVGTQGTRVTSTNFRETPAKSLKEGEILREGNAGDKYTFRIGVSSEQVDISVKWNEASGKWILSSDMGTSKTAGSTLTVQDLSEFMKDTLNKASGTDNPALSNLNIITGKSSSGKITQFGIESRDYHLLSISDVEGNLAAQMGIVNDNPVIEINVESSDSLITIRNKINEKYQEEFGLTEPEQWVHASVENGYLEISANVAGEAQRITLMPSSDGNMQVLRRLGLTRNQLISSDIKDENGNNLVSYREVAYIPETGIAADASFSLNGVHYLSSDNKFNYARRIPAETGDPNKRYSAEALSEISEGMWLNLKNTGSTIINVRHHITNGSIKGLEETRDAMIPNMKSSLDEMSYGLAVHMNAYNYSGYGVSDELTTTGTAFFNQLGMKSGASEKLSVNEKVSRNISLIGAAMGKKNSDGKAVSGISGGSGDGTNAARMMRLNFDKTLENGTMTISEIYDAMLSEIGTKAAHAKLQYTTMQTVNDQIDGQRQAVSGVNLDEELMDITILNRAFGAMSRYITTMDEMLNTIINGMGLVGR